MQSADFDLTVTSGVIARSPPTDCIKNNGRLSTYKSVSPHVESSICPISGIAEQQNMFILPYTPPPQCVVIWGTV